MLVVSSSADKEKALLLQEIDHFKATDRELRQRELDISNQIKNMSVETLNEKKELESVLQKQLNDQQLLTQEANEKAQDLAEQLEIAKQSLEQAL